MEINAQTITAIHAENVKNARRTILANLFSLGFAMYIALGILLLGAITSVPPIVKAFSTDHLGTETRLYPVVNPAVTEEQAVRWVKSAVIDLMSIRFDRYKKDVPSKKKYFYGDGYIKYRDNLNNNVVPVIAKELLIVTAINVGEPKRRRIHRIGDHIQRTYVVVMLQTTQGPTSDRKTEKRIAFVTVTEVPRDESIDGLQIKRFHVRN